MNASSGPRRCTADRKSMTHREMDRARNRRRRLRPSGAAALAILVVLVLGPAALCAGSAGSAVYAVSTPSVGVAARSGDRFSAQDVEALALDYAVEVYRRLEIPPELRHMVDEVEQGRREEIEKIRSSPPTLQSDGVVHPFGPSNPVSFSLNEDGTMTVWNEMIEMEGKMSAWGPTVKEAATALNEASTRKERGGADWAWNRRRDELSLSTTWQDVPRTKAQRERFYRRTLNQHEAFMRWFEGDFSDRLEKIVASKAPPASASAAADDFAATLILRHFSTTGSEQEMFASRYVRAWDRPPRHRRAPRLVSDRSVRQGQRFYVFFHFRGSQNNAEGVSPVAATLRIRRPDGDLLLEDVVVPVWQAGAKAKDFMQIGVSNLDLSLDRAESPGTYRLEARVCDQVSGRCVELSHPLDLEAAR